MFLLVSRGLAKQECIICRKRKTASKRSGYETLTKSVTMQSAMAIIDNPNNIDNTYAKAELMDYTPEVVIAKEFQYHRSC